MPSGLIVQWGYDPREKADAAGHWMLADFPRHFSHRCFFFQANRSYTNNDGAYVGYMHLEHAEPIGLQGVEYRKRYCDQVFWLAIGY